MYQKDPWLPFNLLKSIKKQKRLCKKKTLSQIASEEDHVRYRSYCNLLTKIKIYCKSQYYHEKCIEFRSNTKALWKLINQISGKQNDKTCIVSCLEENGLEYRDPKKIANIFNNYFSTVGKKYANSIKESRKQISCYLQLISNNIKTSYWHPTNASELREIVQQLPNRKSSGYDQIDNVLLKEIFPTIECSLVILFNRLMAEGVFPNSMKVAEVIALYKSKLHSKCTNYRPISLLLTLSKILEKVVYLHTYSFLNKTHQIFDSQYGFRKNTLANMQFRS